MSMPKSKQASRIISKMVGNSPGAPARLARMLTRHGYPTNPTTVYRWNYPSEKGGTNGLVPTQALHQIIYIARIEGVLITTDDLNPYEGRK